MDGSGNVTALHSYGPAGLLGTGRGNGATYYSYDPSGNLASEQYGSRVTPYSGAGNPYYYGHDAYGSTPGGTPGRPVGFSGQFGAQTDETGLVLMGWRYYDPETGRFLLRDPIGYAGGLNLYGYTGNNPVNFVDPM